MFAKNPVLVFTALGSVTEGFLTAGFATFLPKYVQNQLTLTPGSAAVMTGKSYSRLRLIRTKTMRNFCVNYLNV